MDKIEKTLYFAKCTAQVCAAAGLAAYDIITVKHALLKNSNFQLIHVIRTYDGSTSMRIVTPASSRTIRQQVKSEGYYTLSHLWGDSQELQPWTSHGVTDDRDEVIEVKMRPEKRETILKLLADHPGFWWIDVFCAQTDTPLVIMGDIYHLCNRCFALVDFPSDGFEHVINIYNYLRARGAASTKTIVQKYKRRIEGKRGTSTFLWREFLQDMLGGFPGANANDISVCADFLDCRWFTRVWTLQEFILPPKLTFLSELDVGSGSLDRTYAVGIIKMSTQLCKKAFMSFLHEDFGETYDYRARFLPSEVHKYCKSTPDISRCYHDFRSLSANHDFVKYVDKNEEEDGGSLNFSGFLYARMGSVSHTYDPLVFALPTLAKLQRTCTDPCDYIYGIAGFFKLDIPRTDDPRQVWQSFQEVVSRRAPDFWDPHIVDLSRARSMEDVFKVFSPDSPKALKWSEKLSRNIGAIQNVSAHF